MRTVRVMIADDNDDIRLLTRSLLGADGRTVVVAEAEDGTAAVEEFRRTQPDVCVLDHQMPGLNGLDAAAQILSERPGLPVVLFSSFLSTEVVAAAGSLGVTCLRKDLFEDLPDLIVGLSSPEG